MDVNELLNEAAAEYSDEEFEEEEDNNNNKNANNIKINASDILRQSAQKISIDDGKEIKDAMKKEVIVMQQANNNNHKVCDETKSNENLTNNDEERDHYDDDGDDDDDDDDDDANKGDIDCNLLLLIACYRGDHKKVSLLLSGKTYEDDETSSNKKASFKAKDQHGWTALHWSVSKGFLDITKLLVQYSNNKKSYLNQQENECGWSALHIACINGHIDCVEFLLKSGAKKYKLDFMKEKASECLDLTTKAGKEIKKRFFFEKTENNYLRK